MENSQVNQVRELKRGVEEHAMNLAIEKGLIVEVSKDEVDLSPKFIKTLEKVCSTTPHDTEVRWMINASLEMTEGMELTDRVELAFLVLSIAGEKIGTATFRDEFK